MIKNDVYMHVLVQYNMQVLHHLPPVELKARVHRGDPQGGELQGGDQPSQPARKGFILKSISQL